MHYHTEIIIPPTAPEDVASVIDTIMAPFDENIDLDKITDADDRDEARYGLKYAFWDWFRIGGRWSGQKKMAKYDPEKLEEFNKWCQDEKVTVSGIVFGKEEISPADQIPKIDKKWNEMFPEKTFRPCPLFKHSGEDLGDGDIARLGDMSPTLSASRVIIAGPSYNRLTQKFDGPLEAAYMISDSQYNGVNYVDSKWDNTVVEALKFYEERIKNFKDERKVDFTPTADWLTVTVDYHV